MSILNKKKQEGPLMTCVFFPASVAPGPGLAVPVSPGAGLHPRDAAQGPMPIGALAPVVRRGRK